MNYKSKELFKTIPFEERKVFNNASVNGYDVIMANSGGHKCITNISGLNFLGRKTRPSEDPYRYNPDRPDVPYIKFMKDLGKKMVEKIKEKINSSKVEVED